MRYLVALLATTAPALAHPGHGAALHLHEKDGFLIAGIAFVIGVSLSAVAVIKAAKARK
ncbi:hypothetical protein BD830_101150 [Maritimibacter alkaliphilus HTCC2654]|uniref:Uncharacterized protein n=1 Tax=Maritimibacter alkaliphilus HTCC2654 TaxID=314271 RepID=A3VEQ1_9RHOB|nr:hypothetical protein [Maritimibacter alkaliphilus]EAQ13389.1 hypothetical protein RB2654_09974 [Rhodobacterales bacterium HTCC2654] [Maritimibacter alkaliphilus HTCC2654]TYP85192.1 hypothetical protein BD830_101150 [Maritimibacter alkaliphilus HTCC2654]